jgi:hypothetical protein
MLCAKPLKPKKCRNAACGTSFVPSRSFQSWCSPDCALVIARQKQSRERKALDKIERKAIRVAKERVKSRAEHMKEAQAAFNAFIRERDRDLPCISCGRHHQGQWHAGHYRTVGANPELRFELLNVHKQCAPCNNHKSGDIVNYRINLVGRIGADQVAWLEGPHEPQRYTIDELKGIKAKYRALVREMKRGLA